MVHPGRYDPARAGAVDATEPRRNGAGTAGTRTGRGAFAVVAGGTHHLRTPAVKGHDEPFAVIAVDDWAPPRPRPGVRDEAVTIAGQRCTPKDVLARRIRVARLRAGDLVAFGLAGAYAWNISHHGFGMHPPLRSITYHEHD
jgi:diaminopimelate decarboxylase